MNLLSNHFSQELTSTKRFGTLMSARRILGYCLGFGCTSAPSMLYLSFVAGAYQTSGYLSGSTGDRTYFYYQKLDFLKNCLQENNFKLLTTTEKTYPKSTNHIEIPTIFLTQKQPSPS